MQDTELNASLPPDRFVNLSPLCLLVPCHVDAQPTEGEREIWNQISAVLQDSESILADLQAYKGAGPEIRDVRKPMTTTA